MLPYYYITDQKQAEDCIHTLDRQYGIGFDTETYPIRTGATGLDPYQARTRLMQFCDFYKIYVIDMMYVQPWKGLLDFLQQPYFVAHNAKFEWKFMFMQYGINMRDVMYCTQMASQILDNGRYPKHNLKDAALRNCGIDMSKDQQSSDWSAPNLSQEQIEYAAFDPEVGLRLWHQLLYRLNNTEPECAQNIFWMEQQLYSVVGMMELCGVQYNFNQLRILGDELEVEAKDKLIEVQNTLPAIPCPRPKPDSKSGANKFWTKTGKLTKYARLRCPSGYYKAETRDELKATYKHIGVKIPLARSKNPETGRYEMKESLSKETYDKVEHPSGKLYGQYVKIKTLTDKYVNPAFNGEWQNPVTGRIHGSINQNGTATGRFSMEDPNLMQQPREKRFRRLLEAKPGFKILKIDYSTIEMRVMAYLTRDPVMLKAFQDGVDVHSLTATTIYNTTLDRYAKDEFGDFFIPEAKKERQLAKNVNFGSLYGQYAKGLQSFLWKEAGIWFELHECEHFLTSFFGTYPALKPYHEDVHRTLVATGKANGIGNFDFAGMSLNGRIRHWIGLKLTERRTKYGHMYTIQCNEQINNPVQSTVADVMKRVMVRLSYEMDLGIMSSLIHLILQVHDELVFEVREDYLQAADKHIRSVMVDEMVKVIPTVPVEVESTIGDNWAGERLAA